MKNQFCFLSILLCLTAISASAQIIVERQNVSSGGETFVMANDSYMLSSTLGQPVSGFLSNDTYIVTGGFQQSGIEIVKIFNAQDVEINIFPNPGTDFVMIQTQLFDYQVILYDIKGTILYSHVGTNGNFIVEIYEFQAGEYLLCLQNESKRLFSVTKIIKN